MKKLLAAVIAAFMAISLIPVLAQPVEAATVRGISGPVSAKSADMVSGQKSVYDCVWFGKYPQTELVLERLKKEKDTVGLSTEDYDKLINATYDSNGDTKVTLSTGTIKVRRINKSDWMYSDTAIEHYSWENGTAYHYFRYDPIKWRVLSVDDDGSTILMSDKVLDTCLYNDHDIAVTWETSSLRAWLNSTGAGHGFYNSAFTNAEKKIIIKTKVDNTSNPLKLEQAKGGNDTEDNVFLLSKAEVYGTETAALRGFVYKYNMNAPYYDEARVAVASRFAHAKGSDLDESGWWLRSPGLFENRAAYATKQYLYTQGTTVTERGIGVRPAITINLNKIVWSNAGTLATDGTMDEVSYVRPLGLDSDTGSDLVFLENTDNLENTDKNQRIEKNGVYLPYIEKDDSMLSRQRVTYDSIWFGRYPQTELVAAGSAEEKQLIDMSPECTANFVSLSKEDFSKLYYANFDDDDEAIVSLSIGTIRVRRTQKSAMSEKDCFTPRYAYSDDEYHYFRYDPIKWRVLSVDEEGYALVKADQILDEMPMGKANTSTVWENSQMRNWLNSTTAKRGFYEHAFSDSEKAAVKNSLVKNTNNLFYNTDAGNDTYDHVFLLSDAEVYRTAEAKSYGFSMDSLDEALSSKVSLYAYARGAYIGEDNHGEWLLRTPGEQSGKWAYVVGSVALGGALSDNTARSVQGVCPALRIKLDCDVWSKAGTVCTNGDINEIPCNLPDLSIPAKREFTDVPASAWYTSYVEKVNDMGIMTGYNGAREGQFGPGDNLTRAQFATMVYRLAGEPEVSYDSIFPDVPDGKYYSKAVVWCAKNAIITGYAAGERAGYFGSRDDDLIERQQVATILYRYAKEHAKIDVSSRAAYDDAHILDADSVSSYATDAMSWCVSSGIITGKDQKNGTFLIDPKGKATRAEAAAMIVRFLGLWNDPWGRG